MLAGLEKGDLFVLKKTVCVALRKAFWFALKKQFFHLQKNVFFRFEKSVLGRFENSVFVLSCNGRLCVSRSEWYDSNRRVTNVGSSIPNT